MINVIPNFLEDRETKQFFHKSWRLSVVVQLLSFNNDLSSLSLSLSSLLPDLTSSWVNETPKSLPNSEFAPNKRWLRRYFLKKNQMTNWITRNIIPFLHVSKFCQFWSTCSLFFVQMRRKKERLWLCRNLKHYLFFEWLLFNDWRWWWVALLLLLLFFEWLNDYSCRFSRRKK